MVLNLNLIFRKNLEKNWKTENSRYFISQSDANLNPNLSMNIPIGRDMIQQNISLNSKLNQLLSL